MMYKQVVTKSGKIEWQEHRPWWRSRRLGYVFLFGIAAWFAWLSTDMLAGYLAQGMIYGWK